MYIQTRLQTNLFSLSRGASLVRSNLHPRVQWKLVPHQKHLLLLPAPSGIHLLEIKIPEEVGEEESHFQVCEVAAEAVSRADGEGVERGSGCAGFRGLVGRV